MTPSPYWNPRTETLSRDALEALQLRKLRGLVDWTHASAPWQSAQLRKAGVESSDALHSLDDLRRIPFLERQDWMATQEEDPPYGAVLAAPPEAAIRYHTTSGTTGKRPLAVLDGPKDWEWIAEMWCYGFWGFGVRPADVVFFAFSYGTFVGFWGAHYASEKIGCLVLPGGNMTTEARVKQILSMKATVVCSSAPLNSKCCEAGAAFQPLGSSRCISPDAFPVFAFTGISIRRDLLSGNTSAVPSKSMPTGGTMAIGRNSSP